MDMAQMMTTFYQRDYRKSNSLPVCGQN